MWELRANGSDKVKVNCILIWALQGFPFVLIHYWNEPRPLHLCTLWTLEERDTVHITYGFSKLESYTSFLTLEHHPRKRVNSLEPAVTFSSHQVSLMGLS